MASMRHGLGKTNIRFALTAIAVGVVFVLTDHRRDFVGVSAAANEGATAGPVLGTTIARLFLLAFAIVLVVLAGRPLRLSLSPVSAAVGTFTIYLVLSASWSPDPAFTLRKLVVLGTVAVTALCISQIFNLDQIASLTLAVLTGYLVLGALYEVATGNVRFLTVYRFAGTTGANQNGMFAAIVALIAVIRLVFEPNSRRSRRLYALLLVLACGITAVTISRTAMVAFVATMMFAPAVHMTPATTSRRVRVAVSFAAAAIVGAVAYVVLSNHRSANLGSLGYRSLVWEPLWDAAQARPIHGYGYLGYWVSGSRNEVENTHSVYLDLLLDGGAIALLLFLLVAAIVLRTLIIAGRKRADGGTLFGVYFVCFALVHGLAESVFIRPTIGFFLLACVVLRVALDADSRRTGDHRESSSIVPSGPQTTVAERHQTSTLGP